MPDRITSTCAKVKSSLSYASFVAMLQASFCLLLPSFRRRRDFSFCSGLRFAVTRVWPYRLELLDRSDGGGASFFSQPSTTARCSMERRRFLCR